MRPAVRPQLVFESTVHVLSLNLTVVIHHVIRNLCLRFSGQKMSKLRKNELLVIRWLIRLRQLLGDIRVLLERLL